MPQTFVINTPTCSMCGCPTARCRCQQRGSPRRPTNNRQIKLAHFGSAPSEWVGNEESETAKDSQEEEPPYGF